VAEPDVYRADNSHVPAVRLDQSPAAWRMVPRNVWVLGLTSLLTDLSSEMVASVIPVYLVVHLHLSPLAFGALDGLYNGASAAMRWMSGILSDRWRRHKQVAFSGYFLSALSRIGLLAAGGNVTALAAVVAVDRMGKGIRTAPRDALISLSTTPNRLGQSFGVHRALDATGAMLGPVAAFAILAVLPGSFDVVFAASLAVAVVGLGVLMLFAENVTGAASQDSPRPSLRTAIGLLRQREFRNVVIVSAALAALTISDAFVYLALRDRLQFAPTLFPVLYVGTSLSYLLLAAPAGRLADRLGRPGMFLAGHLPLLALYWIMVEPPGSVAGVVLALALLGAYYAATDGVLAALASGLLPPALRGSGLALLATATSGARLLSSVGFGSIWVAMGKDPAILIFGVALSAVVVVSWLRFQRSELRVHNT
jgi:MFS family permease